VRLPTEALVRSINLRDTALLQYCLLVLTLKPALNVIFPYKFGVFEDADGSIIGLEPICPLHTFDLDPAFILYMSVVTFGADLEAGLIFEHSKFKGPGMVGACLVLSMGRPSVIAD
jgi:hypothetical protein